MTDDLDEVCLCEVRIPHRVLRQLPWEALEASTIGFGEVTTRKCFVPTEPVRARNPVENEYTGSYS